MGNVEREEGFWWVRGRENREDEGENDGAPIGRVWIVAQVYRAFRRGAVRLALDVPGVSATWGVLADNPDIEWGPYLGKEPETIESLDRKIAEMMATRLPLFADFDPSTDYEGEQTRALDGAGIERAYQRTVEADDEERRAAFVRTGCQGGFDDGWAAGVEWGRRP
jgi:hypothetical protein